MVDLHLQNVYSHCRAVDRAIDLADNTIDFRELAMRARHSKNIAGASRRHVFVRGSIMVAITHRTCRSAFREPRA
jgi:hypothetical protein